MKMEIERQFAKFRRFRQAIGQFSQPKRVNLRELPTAKTAFCTYFARLPFRKPLKTKDFEVCETAAVRLSHARPPTALRLPRNCHPRS